MTVPVQPDGPQRGSQAAAQLLAETFMHARSGPESRARVLLRDEIYTHIRETIIHDELVVLC